MRSLFRLLLIGGVASATGAAAAPNPCTEFGVGDGPQITEGLPQPGWSSVELDAWWAKMKACREWQLASVSYNATAFKNRDLDWTQRAFAIPMVQGYDRFLFDQRTGTYTVDRLVDDLLARYGGADAVFLWPTYTNIGVDNRNQLDLFRAMPGGLEALKNVSIAFRARGVHVMWGYNPWSVSRWVVPRLDSGVNGLVGRRSVERPVVCPCDPSTHRPIDSSAHRPANS